MYKFATLSDDELAKEILRFLGSRTAARILHRERDPLEAAGSVWLNVQRQIARRREPIRNLAAFVQGNGKFHLRNWWRKEREQTLKQGAIQ